MTPAGAGGVAGTWDLVIRTPVGRLDVALVLRADADGALTGQAIGAAESVPLQDVALDGDRLTWRQTVTRPMRLTLYFEVVVDGQELSGTSRAGRLPRSRVEGRRRPATDGATS